MGEPRPAVEIEQVSRRFGSYTALDRVDLTIHEGEFFSLLGPSGCGKTTLLRIIGGLDLPDEGSVRIAGVDARGIPAHRRPVNTVFQSYALFPHLDVRDNIAFGLRMKKLPPAVVAERVDRAIEMVQIDRFADRKPSQLSGGQKQRVALARAFVNEPKVLLLDEPLGALDLKLRKELQVELLALQRRLGITFVFVTHDQEEALVMSDRIAVMRAGTIDQLGAADALYERPRNRFVGQFLGSCNLIEGRVESWSDRRATASTAWGPLHFEPAPEEARREGAITLAIRPEKVVLCAASEAPEGNRVPVTVKELIYIGSQTQYLVAAGGETWTVYRMNARPGVAEFALGQEAVVHLPPAALIVLED